MIIGIGTDLIEIERVKNACRKEHFKKRCFTKGELEVFDDSSQKLAGNYAVKEAVAKAFGTGFRGFELRDIEVLRDELGKPYVVLYNEALKKSEELGAKRIHVSISNVKEYATAYVILEA